MESVSKALGDLNVPSTDPLWTAPLWRRRRLDGTWDLSSQRRGKGWITGIPLVIANWLVDQGLLAAEDAVHISTHL